MRRLGLRFVALGYLAAVILVGPLSIVFWRTFEDGFAPAWDALTTPRRPRVQADLDHHGDCGAGEHVFDPRRARDRTEDVPWQERALNASSTCRSLSRRRRRRPRCSCSTARTAGWGWPERARNPCRPPAVIATIFVSILRLRSCRRSRRSATSRSKRQGRWSHRLADLLADHAAFDPLGRDLRRHPHDRPLPQASTASVAVVSGRLQGQTETATLRCRSATRASISPAPTRSPSCWRACDSRPRRDDRHTTERRTA